MPSSTSAAGALSLDQIASCVAGYDPNALPVAQAQEFIARLVPRVQAVEQLAIRSALGRVLAQDVISPIAVPAHDNSAMDGYALRSADLAVDGDTVMAVAGTQLAGQAVGSPVPAGQARRIMTGAVMPEGFDTVVPQEFTHRADDGRIRIPAGIVKPGDNRRLRGEDLALGEPALRAGRILSPADLGLLASLGQAEVPVFRRLRVAFFSTGANAVVSPCRADSHIDILFGEQTASGGEHRGRRTCGIARRRQQHWPSALGRPCRQICYPGSVLAGRSAFPLDG